MNRESAVFLGAGRAALLQLAHPWVAVALAHHSNLLNDAIGRFHSTFRVIYTMLFGTRAQAIEASKRLYQRHTGIRGELPHRLAPMCRASTMRPTRSPHCAGCMPLWWRAQSWPTTLCCRRSRPANGSSTTWRANEWPHSSVSAAEDLPQDWAAFSRYTAEMFDSPQLCVDDNARALSRSVLSGVGTWLHPPHWYLSLTAFWMPSRLRAGFALQFGPREQQAVDRAARWLPRLYPRMPAMLRFVGPFHEAEARLHGRSPGMLTRKSNRFWMGEPRLLYSDESR